MASSYTSKIGLEKPADNDTAWGTPLRANSDQIDVLGAVGPLAVCQTEFPSTTLNVKVAAGNYRKSDGTIVSYAGTSSQAMTASNTNYVYLTDSGTLTVSTSAFPSATFIVRLATVVAGGSTITSVTDSRVPWISFGANNNTVYLALAGGTFSDGSGVVTVGTGTTNGVKFGASTSDKLAFFNATPIVQPANTVELVTLLGNLGLRATGGNPALNLGSGTLTCGLSNLGDPVTITDAKNIVVGSTTGTKIGTATTQKLAFFNATPVVQPSGANEAALTDSTGGTAGFTLSAVGATNGSDVSGTINSNLASLARLLNQIRSDLVTLGLIKGSS